MNTYRVKYTCKNCNKELSDYQRLESDGVCPICGAVSEGTVVACNKSAVELIQRTYKEPTIDLAEYAGTYGGYKPDPEPKKSWKNLVCAWVRDKL